MANFRYTAGGALIGGTLGAAYKTVRALFQGKRGAELLPEAARGAAGGLGLGLAAGAVADRAKPSSGTGWRWRNGPSAAGAAAPTAPPSAPTPGDAFAHLPPITSAAPTATIFFMGPAAGPLPYVEMPPLRDIRDPAQPSPLFIVTDRTDRWARQILDDLTNQGK